MTSLRPLLVLILLGAAPARATEGVVTAAAAAGMARANPWRLRTADVAVTGATRPPERRVPAAGAAETRRAVRVVYPGWVEAR